MTGTLWELVAAVVAFVGSHFVLSAHAVRAPIVGAIGENGFRAAFSLVALATLVWAVVAFRGAPYLELFVPNMGMRHLSLTVMVLASVLLTTGLRRDNPSMASMAGGELRATGIVAVTRHPVMWAIGLWALVHLAANGDLASWLFFGGIGVLAFGGAALQDRKKARQLGPKWEEIAARTSYLPFAAMIAGRARTSISEIGWMRIAAGVALYLVLLYGHEWVIGVSPLPF